MSFTQVFVSRSQVSAIVSSALQTSPISSGCGLGYVALVKHMQTEESKVLQARKHLAFVSDKPVLRQYRLLPEHKLSTPGHTQMVGLIIVPFVFAQIGALQLFPIPPLEVTQSDGMQPGGVVLSVKFNMEK